MSLSDKAAHAAGEKLSSVRAGDQKLSIRRLGGAPSFPLHSDWFKNGDTLPTRCSVDGDGVPPPLVWTNAPSGTQSFALICEDPDAPSPEPFVHWLVYNIPGAAGELDEGRLEAVLEGQNSKLKVGFTGAAPPRGHGIHHYHFQLFALDTTLSLDGGAGRDALLKAMQGHVLGCADLVGTYQRV